MFLFDMLCCRFSNCVGLTSLSCRYLPALYQLVELKFQDIHSFLQGLAFIILKDYFISIMSLLNRVCYAYTRSSLCLLESVCRCVQMNEPILLVGETGVGKTAVVNYLSQLTGNYYQSTIVQLTVAVVSHIVPFFVGNKLTAFNVCQQTDSSELLGG